MGVKGIKGAECVEGVPPLASELSVQAVNSSAMSSTKAAPKKAKALCFELLVFI